MGMDKVLERVKGWRKLAKNIDDDFIKFIVEYIAFNALARKKYGYIVGDNTLVVNRVGSDIPKDLFKKENLDDLKELMPLKNVRNVKRNSGEKEIKKEDLEKAENVVKAIYWIRCNLFHGDKEYNTSEKVYSRDAALVKVGYQILKSLNDWLIENLDKRECEHR
ncbi:hypothetical protein ACMC56_16755 (plasmid) [Campylobacterota bacterium DY0563]